jgi:hypothetical protein
MSRPQESFHPVATLARTAFTVSRDYVVGSPEVNATINGLGEVDTSLLNATANKNLRIFRHGSAPFIPEIVILHETATPAGTTGEQLDRRHLSRAIGTSWN